MSSSITSSINFGAPLSTHLMTKIIPTPTPTTIANELAVKSVFPGNSGSIARFIGIKNLQPNLSPVAAGTQGNNPATLSYNTIDVLMQAYNDSVYMDITNIAQSQIDIPAVAIEKLAVSIVQLEDLLTIGVLTGVPTQYDCKGGANGDIPTNPSLPDFEAISTSLVVANAVPVSSAIRGEDRFGTQPTATSFMMLVNSALITSLRTNSDFQKVETYVNPDTLPFLGEVGSMGRMRVCASNNIPFQTASSALGNTVFVCPYFGADSYHQVHQENFGGDIVTSGAAFSGANMLQVAASAKSMVATVVTQTTWAGVMRCTGSV